MEKNPVLNFKYDYVGTNEEDELVIVGIIDKGFPGTFMYKYGFVDRYGNEVVPCMFDGIHRFVDGVAPVYINGKGWGFIDKEKVLVTPKYLSSQNQRDICGTISNGLVVFKNKNKKYACLSKEDKLVAPFEYDDIDLWGYSHEGLIRVTKKTQDGELFGLLDKDGKEILPCKYNRISDFKNGVASVEIEGNKYWINKEGKEVGQPEITESKSGDQKEYKAVERDGKYGIVDSDGNAITPFKYDCIRNILVSTHDQNTIKFSYNGYAEVEINGLRGLIDETGKEVVPCIHEVIQNISNGMFVSVSYYSGKKFGLYSISGEEILPKIYNDITVFDNGLVSVIKGNKYAIIGVSSETEIAKEPEKKLKVKKVKVPFNYANIGTFSEGLVSVCANSGYYGYIDNTGKEIVPCKYGNAHDFSEGLAAVRVGGKWGFIDGSNNEVIQFKYDGAHDFSEGLATVRVDDKWGFIDGSNNEVIPFKYDGTHDFSEGLAAVRVDGKWGFIDGSDKEIIPFRYDLAKSFSEGLAAVRVDGKWGFIDKSGNEVIPCRYEDVMSFSEGRASVLSNNKYGFIDKEGNEVIPCRYDGVGNYSEGLASVFSKFRYGYIDMDGNEVIPCKYHSAEEFKDGLAIVSLEGKFGAIDKKGEVVVLLRYDKITIGDEYISVREGKKCGLADKEGKSI